MNLKTYFNEEKETLFEEERSVNAANLKPRRGARQGRQKPDKSEELYDNRKPKRRNNFEKVNETKRSYNTRNSKSVRSGNKRGKNEPFVRVTFLGGLNEIGKNITLFECKDDMILVDCGMAFPDVDMLGVDLVLPDFSYVIKNQSKIRGIVITHGHEDHIGALPYLLKDANIPVFGTPLSIGLIGSKLKEHSLFNKAKLNTLDAGDKIKLGCMEIEFIHVNHSIPDAVGLAIHTPAGTLVHTGDFKVDFTPIQDDMIDLAKFGQLGKEGVLALFADSTNADRPGYTMTERKVGSSFDNLFRQAEKKRIIVASFASNVSRVQQIIDCAVKYNRKVAFSGRSMVTYMGIAKDLGYLNIPAGVQIELDLLNQYPKEKTVLITTGSQGEPMSALARMANSDHRKIEVGPEDFIIISANPIPGNEKTVGTVINDLMKLGCSVAYESIHEVHVSGHACQEELKIIHGLVKPQFFIPVHGEQKHLRRHADIAKEMGLDASNIFIGDIGDVIEISKNGMKKVGVVPVEKVFVDGLGIGDVGNVVLRDRRHLSQDGLIIVVATLDSSDGHVIAGPDIVSRGFVYVRESESLINEARKKVLNVLEKFSDDNIQEWGIIKSKIKEDLSKLFYEKTKRGPMILPILMEV